ncbi:MAG TPA: transaldolase [Trueperaceae bacterium]|nr:transaldolase [Trueperaceae bacterium]
MSNLKRLQEFGQSVYMDEIRRSWLTDGTLKGLIDDDGLRGVTSNPAIFQKAIGESDDYDEAVEDLARRGADVRQAYEELVVHDIRDACDLFRPTYDASDGRYGYVSLEVSPHLAHDTDGTIREARHLWQRLGRPNAFIKVPGTAAGLPAIRQLISEGINVNVTLLFGLGRYREVTEAYLGGLEDRLKAGGKVERVASVASFFLSRIDVMIDPMLEKIAHQGGPRAETARDLHGEIAVASAKQAYAIYQEVFSGKRYRALEKDGARTQRVLWASTSTKNPDYSDIKYVEPLIGPDTINTMPRETLDAYRDHGEPAARVTDDQQAYGEKLRRLADVDIDIDEITQALEDEGVDKFVKPFDQLTGTLQDALAKAPA